MAERLSGPAHVVPSRASLYSGPLRIIPVCGPLGGGGGGASARAGSEEGGRPWPQRLPRDRNLTLSDLIIFFSSAAAPRVGPTMSGFVGDLSAEQTTKLASVRGA